MLNSAPRMRASRVQDARIGAASGPQAAPRRRVAAAAAAGPVQPANPLLMAAIEALFKFPPFFNFAAKNARSMIVKRGEALGLPWKDAMKRMASQDWGAAIAAVQNPSIRYPDYYTQPFHAYPEGNLCWEAAQEVTLAAQSVHSPVFDPAGKALDPQGDAKLRSTYGERMKELMAQLGSRPVRDVLDVGCATGLSTLALARQFPGAQLTGLDLSPHFLAVGRYEQQQRLAAGGAPEPISFVHGLGEATGLPDASLDLVSICLVCHELPEAASRAIFREAARVLRPGGTLSVMEMNPESPTFQRICSNPFVFTAFSSTEPWLREYVALAPRMEQAMLEAGFRAAATKTNTPRHKTVVAVKAQ